jgi:RNA-binding protein
MSGLHLQEQHILLETVPVQYLEDGRILNLVLSERDDFTPLHTRLLKADAYILIASLCCLDVNRLTKTEGAGANMISSKAKNRMKRELTLEKPTIWVGKEGASPQTMNEISRQLEKRKMVKVQILKSALGDESAKDIASKTAQQTGSILIDVRGHTFILHKPRKKRSEKPL